MSKTLKLLLCCAAAAASATLRAQNDTLFVYSPDERAGLHVAAGGNGQWQHLGQLCASDYGQWGAEKRMYAPSLCHLSDGTWRLVFQVNDKAPLFAAAYSADLLSWRPQDYPLMATRQCLDPAVRSTSSGFEVQFTSEGRRYSVQATADFRHFSAPEAVRSGAEFGTKRSEEPVSGKRVAGQKFVVSSDEMGKIRRHFAKLDADAKLTAERMYDDATRLAHLQQPVSATLAVDVQSEKTISDKLIGIFFEDISYAADGGLYAELVQNRDFEYSARDHRDWTATTAWHADAPIRIATDRPLSPVNPHYALVADQPLWNEGWDGIAIERGEKYNFAMHVRGTKTFVVELVAADGTIAARGTVNARGNAWRRYTTVLTASRTLTDGRLRLRPQGKAEAAIDMVSLFPQRTFRNRLNGLRRDLAEAIAALKPKFVRFPGGCMSHGQGLDNIYHWHESIGPLHERRPDFNIWHYHQTRGLGFFEYFQFCEDIGAEPLPVLAAGVPCQNSAANADGVGGQQGGIVMADMPAYIDELCNLIDWANADPATNTWARRRAEAGHPAPFNLKYIGIGNEDIISTVFEERYEMICKALRERHPEITICGTVGPFHTPSADYIEGWDFTRRHPALQDMVDEHYYESTGWFLHHRNYYDNYAADLKPITAEAANSATCKVYLGEWAASTKVKRPNLETALAEALYLTDIERNADVVAMTSYAPMFCKDGHHNWDPDMIYFTNTTVRTTPAYEVQRLFSVYSGDRYVSTSLRLDTDEQLGHRVGASLVRDSRTGRRYLKLVNALPVELRLSVSGLQLPATVSCEQFSGRAIDDQRAAATTIETSTPTILPPYTMRVISL